MDGSTEDADDFTLPYPAAASASYAPVFSAATMMDRKPDKETERNIKLGDFGEEANRAMREEEEHTWMIKKDATIECYSSGLLYPNQCVVLGTNGRYSLAISCVDMGEMEEAPDMNQTMRAYQRAQKYNESYAKVNPLFAYKMILGELERKAYMDYGRSILKHCAASEVLADVFREELDAIKTGDISLCAHAAALQVGVIKKREHPTAENKSAIFYDDPRPGNCYAAFCEVESQSFQEPQQEDDTLAFIEYRVLVCRTPNFHKKRTTSWRDVNLSLKVNSTTVPTATFNETSLLVVYCNVENPFMVRVETYSIEKLATSNNRNPQPLWSRSVLLPVDQMEKRTQVLLHLHLADDSSQTCSMAFGGRVMLFPTAASAERISVYGLFTENKKHLRTITCVSVTPDGQLLCGTDYGECYRMDMSVGEYAVSNVPAVEPIFAIHWIAHSHALMMQTVMNLFVEIPGAPRFDLQNQRILGTSRCGQLVFFLSKYGYVQAHNLFVRGMWRRFDPPPPDKNGTNVIPLQHAYHAIQADRDRIVALYPNGMIRVIALTQMNL